MLIRKIISNIFSISMYQKEAGKKVDLHGMFMKFNKCWGTTMFATSHRLQWNPQWLSINEDSVAFLLSTVPDQACPVSKTEQIWGIWWHEGGHEVKQSHPCLSEAEIRTDLIQAICTTAYHLHLHPEPFQFERNKSFKGPVYAYEFHYA